MACHDLKACKILSGNPERDQGRIIAGHKIGSACFQLPAGTLIELRKTGILQGGLHIFDRKERDRAVVQKIKQLRIYFFKIQVPDQILVHIDPSSQCSTAFLCVKNIYR